MKKLFYFTLACLLMSNVFGQQKICDSIYIDSLTIKDRNFNFVSRNDSKTQIDYPKFHLLSTSGDTLTKLFSATYIIPNYNWTYYAQIKGNLQLPDQVVLHLNSKLINSVHCEFPLNLIQVNTEQNLKFCDSIRVDSFTIKNRQMSFLARTEGTKQINYPRFILTGLDLDTLIDFQGAAYVLPYTYSSYSSILIENMNFPDKGILHFNSFFYSDSLFCEFPIDLKQVITTVEKNKKAIISSLTNPIQHNFKIELNEIIEGTITVMKASGEQVYKSNINDNSVKVSLDKSLNAGVYLISIQSNEGENGLLEKVVLE